MEFGEGEALTGVRLRFRFAIDAHEGKDVLEHGRRESVKDGACRLCAERRNDRHSAVIAVTAFADYVRDDGETAVHDTFHDPFKAAVAALKAEGCNVLDKVDDSDFGKFGWVIDPEGNKVELWQPPAGG